jgi:signal transduction histidine kinase
LENEELKKLVALLEERNQLLLDRERDLADRSEELISQKEELTAAIEEVVEKNSYLNETLTKLQQRNKELDQILYRASHDLRSPVSSIFGLLDLFKAGGLNESQQLIHKHLSEKASQMMALLQSLTALSQAAFDKIQAKRIVLQKISDEVIESFKEHSNYKSTTFHTSIDSSLPCTADELKLTIILRCLIGNALIYRPESKNGNIWITAQRKQEALSMEIADDGDGILPDVRDKVFDMFYRGSERSQGAGLGLYIVKSVVDRLEGEILFESVQGKTVFKIVLPGCYPLG